MGPKKGKQKESKKNAEKKKEKVIEDRTFGLKNKKKSKVVQQYVQQVNRSVKGVSSKQERDNAIKKQNAKQAKEDKTAVMKDLFMAAITQPKVPPGTDPKSILCEFFKHGCCTKGVRCKFSHDLNVGRKAAKIDLYKDKRDEEKEKKVSDVIEDWDQTKLEKVINEKHGAANQTEIVCKYFLDAIEKSQYGWFWTCPNGGKDCKYRHALPPGYVYKTREERELEKNTAKTKIVIEELIEQQRAKLGSKGGTPVTAESLAQWKKDKAARKAAQVEEKRKAEAKKGGNRGLNVLSGRALFTYDPSLFQDDIDAQDESSVIEADDLEEESDMENRIDAAMKVMDTSLYVQEDI